MDNETKGWGGFSEEEERRINEQLRTGLPKEFIKKRVGAGGQKFDYVEGGVQMEIANHVFGALNWSSRVLNIDTDFCKQERDKWCVGASALVRVQIKNGAMHEDIGYGTSKDSNQGNALDKARKAAVTDGRKRALRCFGELLGNSLKHKDDHTKALNENLGNDSHSLNRGPRAAPQPKPTPQLNRGQQAPPSASAPPLQPIQNNQNFLQGSGSSISSSSNNNNCSNSNHSSDSNVVINKPLPQVQHQVVQPSPRPPISSINQDLPRPPPKTPNTSTSLVQTPCARQPATPYSSSYQTSSFPRQPPAQQQTFSTPSHHLPPHPSPSNNQQPITYPDMNIPMSPAQQRDSLQYQVAPQNITPALTLVSHQQNQQPQPQSRTAVQEQQPITINNTGGQSSAQLQYTENPSSPEAFQYMLTNPPSSSASFSGSTPEDFFPTDAELEFALEMAEASQRKKNRTC